MRTCHRPKQCSLLGSIFLLFLGLSVKIRLRNKSACFESKPVQCSRCKSTTCLRKRCLLRFQMHSTATSDGSCRSNAGCKNLETYSVMILNRQRRKFAAKTVANEKQCSQFESLSHLETFLDWSSFNF